MAFFGGMRGLNLSHLSLGLRWDTLWASHQHTKTENHSHAQTILVFTYLPKVFGPWGQPDYPFRDKGICRPPEEKSFVLVGFESGIFLLWGVSFHVSITTYIIGWWCNNKKNNTPLWVCSAWSLIWWPFISFLVFCWGPSKVWWTLYKSILSVGWC